MSLFRSIVLLAALGIAGSLLAACGGGGGSNNNALYACNANSQGIPGSALCGNGRIDSGERCDDGNCDDADDCTTTCQPARCGDGIVHLGVEECDGRNLQQQQCSDFGLAGNVGLVRCTADCHFDTSACGAALTPTPTPMDTPTPTTTFTPNGDTPTATPTATPQPCGNGILEAGEVCAECPAGHTCSECPTGETCQVCPDCEILTCNTPGEPMQIFAVDFVAPLGQAPSVVSVLVGYRSDRVSLPTSRTGSRVTNRPPGTSQLVSGQDYAVRVVINAQAGGTIPDGQLFTVNFDSCEGADPVSAADFGCTVESCGSSSGPIDGCRCAVTMP